MDIPVLDNSIIAERIARNAFEGKFDRAGKPYYEHLKSVADRVVHNARHRDYDSLWSVAILHDLLEDCPEWNEFLLKNIFLETIVDAVVVLTKGKNEPYEDYITRVLQHDVAVLVKKADLEHNMDITRLSELTKKDIERLKKYHKAYLRITNHLKEGKL